MITSVQNPRILEIARLRRTRLARGELVLIDGGREIQRAFAAGWAIQELYHCPRMLSQDDRQWLASAGMSNGVLIEVNEPVLERIAYGDRTDGMVAIAARPARRLNDLVLNKRPLVAVVHGLEKPGNLGGILRSADAAGIEAVLVSDARTDVYNSSVIRASTGAVFSMPIVECTAAEAASFLREHGIALIAARPDCTQEYTDGDYRGPTAFILGAESAGLGSAWQGNDIQSVRIAMSGICDSLNVSVTAAVMFFEARRQRSPS